MQADRSLRWAHMSEGTLSAVTVQLYCYRCNAIVSRQKPQVTASINLKSGTTVNIKLFALALLHIFYCAAITKYLCNKSVLTYKMATVCLKQCSYPSSTLCRELLSNLI